MESTAWPRSGGWSSGRSAGGRGGVAYGTGDLTPPSEVLRVAGDVVDRQVGHDALGAPRVAGDEPVGDVVPAADDGVGLEHLIGDRRRQAVLIAGLETLVERGGGAFEAEVVELEGVVLGRAVEADLGAGSAGEEPALVGAVTRDDEHRDEQVDVIDRPAG